MNKEPGRMEWFGCLFLLGELPTLEEVRRRLVLKKYAHQQMSIHATDRSDSFQEDARQYQLALWSSLGVIRRSAHT